MIKLIDGDKNPVVAEQSDINRVLNEGAKSDLILIGLNLAVAIALACFVMSVRNDLIEAKRSKGAAILQLQDKVRAQELQLIEQVNVNNQFEETIASLTDSLEMISIAHSNRMDEIDKSLDATNGNIKVIEDARDREIMDMERRIIELIGKSDGALSKRISAIEKVKPIRYSLQRCRGRYILVRSNDER